MVVIMICLTVTEYLCHRTPWIRYAYLCTLTLSRLITEFLTKLTQQVPPHGAGTDYPSGAHKFTPGFSGDHAAQTFCLFVLFHFAIVLSVLPQSMTTITSLVSSNFLEVKTDKTENCDISID
jgi:hypothetical protein